jgi:plasmid stabilization system protein ParE
MARLIWSPQAIRDLTEISDRIARRDANAARRFAAQFYSLADDLRAQPYLGATVPEYRDPNLRERIHKKYRLVYRLRGPDVEIVTVHHGAKPLPRTPPA